MDISFAIQNEKFNYRVCAVIIDNNRILAMKDERSPYFYLPGGRVKMGETAEQAIIRELKEELYVTAKIVRPLWLNQSFFNEDVEHIDYHELCIYFLVDVADTDLLHRGEKFELTEENKTLSFEWLPFESLKEQYFYPLFIKDEIFNLPKGFTLRVENE